MEPITPISVQEITIEVVANDLNIPWEVIFLKNGTLLITERTGDVVLISEDTKKTVWRTEVRGGGEGGLLGMTLHPEFEDNRWVYVYYTYRTLNDRTTKNKVERYTFTNDQFTEPITIIDDIPGARFHDGGRVAFGPDGLLYVTTGDATNPRLAQDITSLAGKILRVNENGEIPEDNPFSNAVYSYGHRNPQGIAWDKNGNLWSTEHGRSGIRSGFDEVNLIKRGGNYGWPDSQGDTALPDTIPPALHSGASTTWAPAGATIRGDSLFFGGLRGETLYEATLQGERVTALQEHFKEEFGRIRTTIVNDNVLYFTTSNRDGRGRVREGDDAVRKVIFRKQGTQNTTR